ncbi:hypothetical protein G6F62_003322 [Rhizopus arrhizus]|nr:hypothetical protein G6F62_003322 [Rhizopus arrhizus]
MVLETYPEAVDTFQRLDIFEQMKQACELKDQDYRVITLSIRLMGQVVHFGRSSTFICLERDHPELLRMITGGLRSSEPALRCSCLQACKLFVSCDEGQRWLCDNKEAASLITLALLDQSAYVVSEACRLFLTLLILKSPLVDVLDPAEQIKSVLSISSNPSQVMAALEFCWSMVSSEETLDYLHRTRLLSFVIPLMCSTNRMICSRVIEILSVLFSWDLNPIKTLGLNGQETLSGAYEIMIKMAKEMMLVQSINQVMTATSLLDTSLELLKRTPCEQDITQTLIPLLDICLGRQTHTEFDHVKLALKSNRDKNNLLQSVLRTLNKLALIQTTVLQDSEFHESFLAVFKNQSDYMDHRVLKNGLTLLQTLFSSFKDKSRIIHLLANMMEKDAFDAKGISLLLETFDVFLNDLDMETSGLNTWIETLSLKFFDTEWDIRDAAIHFVGELFRQPTQEYKITFALKYNLPLKVLDRLNDSEPFIRASAVDVLQNMMKSKRGWDYLQQHQQSRYFLASQLPSLLYDTEAFVRRATLDAICCLVENRSCQGMKMEIENKPNSINPEIIKTLVDDQDPDVRVRACRLIEQLWYLYEHEKQQQKKRECKVEWKEVIFFHFIHADELLIQAANDTHRLVRMEAVRIISSLMKKVERQERKRGLEDEFVQEFLNKLSKVNIEQQKQTLDPEHLYEEAFDVNVDMMTNHKMDDVLLDCE